VSLHSMYHERIKAAYSNYSFWEALPLFEFFCLARILPYMTNEREKECILNGLDRIFNEVMRPKSIALYNGGSDFGDQQSVTVIVPCLGSAMEEKYQSGCAKLLALNVSFPRVRSESLIVPGQRTTNNRK
jgi:hypothetical protein